MKITSPKCHRPRDLANSEARYLCSLASTPIPGLSLLQQCSSLIASSLLFHYSLGDDPGEVLRSSFGLATNEELSFFFQSLVTLCRHSKLTLYLLGVPSATTEASASAFASESDCQFLFRPVPSSID